MSASTWRALAIGLALVCTGQWWCGGGRSRAIEPCATSVSPVERRGGRDASRTATAAPSAGRGHESDRTELAPGSGGIRLPRWLAPFGPRPGEDLLSYRDRIVPVAQAAVAPHRARVARNRDDFAAVAGLDPQQLAALDAAVEEAATAIQDQVLEAALGGELSPGTFKPITGVALARRVLEQVERAQRRFTAGLRADQRTALDAHSFDVAEYLLFSTRWEDAVGATH